MLQRFSNFFHSFRGIPFVRDVFTLQIGRVIYTIATFAASIAFARILGVEEYGLYAVVLAFVSTLKAFINLGQSTTLQVFFAEEYGKKNRRGMACVLKNFLQVSCVHIMLLGALAIAARTLSIAFYDNIAIGSFAIAVFVFHMFEVANSGMLIILQAIRRIKLKAVLEQSAVITALVLGVTALFLGYGIWGIIISQLVTSMAFVVISAILYRKMMPAHGLPGLWETLRTKSKDTQEYLKQGLWFAADKSVGNLYPSGLFFILSLVAPAATVGIAKIALQLASLSSSLILPQIAELSTTVLANMKSKGTAVLRRSSAKIVKHSLALHAFFSISALIAFPFIIPVFYGQEYSAAIPMTSWLILFSLPGPLSMMNSPILRIFRKIHYSIIWGAIVLISMFGAIIVFATVFTPNIGFIIAYSLGQILPILLAVYMFKTLLGKDKKGKRQSGFSRRAQNMKHWAANLALLVIALTATLLFLEWGLRITGIQRIVTRRPQLHQKTDAPGVNYELRPNLNKERGYNWERISTNSLGFRGPEPDPKKPNIAVLGDSFAFGFGVNDNQTNAHILRMEFPEYNVYNLGVSGYNIEQIVRACVPKFDYINPKLVILQFYWNDMRPPSILTDEKLPEVYDLIGYLNRKQDDERMKKAITKPGTLKIPFKPWLQKNSSVFNFVEKRTKWLPFRSHDDNTFVESITNDDLSFYRKWLAKLSRASEGAEKIFVIWPEASLHMEARPKLHKMAKDYGWHVLDLYDIFGMGYDKLYWDWHPTPKVQKRVGNLLAEMIKEYKLLE